jgi:hypothetical protein
MNYSPTTPFHLIHFNAQHLPPAQLAAWQSLVSDAAHDPSLPSTPLLYVLVESGLHPPAVNTRGWTAFHLPGPPPKNVKKHSGGGISLLYHSDCPIRPLPQHTARIDPLPNTDHPGSSAVVCAIVRPKHRSPFLLAAVYLPPQCARGDEYLTIINSHIEAATIAHPHLPLLVVGDFNCHHVDWHCPMALKPLPSPNTPPANTPCANALASWIDLMDLEIANPPNMPTRVVMNYSQVVQSSTIDLVVSSPGLVSAISQRHAHYLRSDHIPLTIELSLPSSVPAARGALLRPRVTWDQHRDVECWQVSLPTALSTALSPLQPLLSSLAQPLPPSTTAQAVMDSVYDQFEDILRRTCLDVVGTKVVTPSSSPWLSRPGVYAARQAQKAALKAVQHHPSDPARHHRLRSARAVWRKVSREAKHATYIDLCQQIMSKDSKLRWSMFKRASPSTFTSLASIADPITDALPIDHASSLDNLCSSFVANSLPPPPHDPSAQLSLEQRCSAWADPLHPSIPSHPSDSWSFTPAQVEEQCTRQHTNSAPGPDSLLPVFLRHAGTAAWTALAAIYSFSFHHSVTPQAWREANVMALYKGAGDKSQAGSYRPISMTSIIIRTLEHLIHRQLAEELEGRRYFSDTQFGFRKGHSTSDAINYLLTSIQRVIGREGKGRAPQCPVLFLDIQKAFDRVDHNILLQRVHDAGITGKAWLWLRSFLSNRRMRCVDASEYSDWQPIQYGVPQGCVLSPLLFLIFINDLQKTIAADDNCSLLSPTFFADDGTIGPHPTNCLPSVSSFEEDYLDQLHTAIDHLDRWCRVSRMRFGSAKTQLVLFTTRQRPDPSLYQSLTLCGFTISISPEYKYLGVYVRGRSPLPQQRDKVVKQNEQRLITV